MNVARTVVVRNLSIPISIGVHEHEKKAPQRLLVSVEAQLAPSSNGSDRLESTLDYDLICDFIRSLARRPHIDLQETVARLVLEFTLRLPDVQHVLVETRKPDVFADCDYVGVRLSAKVTE